MGGSSITQIRELTYSDSSSCALFHQSKKLGVGDKLLPRAVHLFALDLSTGPLASHLLAEIPK